MKHLQGCRESVPGLGILVRLMICYILWSKKSMCVAIVIAIWLANSSLKQSSLS